MIELTIEADFRLVRLSLDEGISKGIELLRALMEIPAFSSGWEARGVRLSADEGAFAGALRGAQDGEGAQAGYHFAIAENARAAVPGSLPAESYLAEVSFDNVQGYLEVRLSLARPVAGFQIVRGALHRLAAWSALQHVSATPAFYASDDSPIDPVNRRGIGWIGWVPFPLAAARIPEAGYLEPLGGGTLLASQEAYWEVTDRAAVKRAQALEMGLNRLGMLPTRDALARGRWGDTGAER